MEVRLLGICANNKMETPHLPGLSPCGEYIINIQDGHGYSFSKVQLDLYQLKSSGKTRALYFHTCQVDFVTLFITKQRGG
jgi:hypothetical protein